MDRVNNGTQGANNSFVNGTVLDAEWNQNLQEELIGIIEDAGLTPDNAQQGQILTAVNLKASIGVNQTWQDVTGSRVGGATYTNSTGRPITVNITGVASPSSGASMALTVGGIVVCRFLSSSDAQDVTCSAVVPNGQTYSVIHNYGSHTWAELR